MVDFHTHILPRMDDGSWSTRLSLDMIRMEVEMGIDTVILTPHFYASQNSPERFLARRQRAWERLWDAMADNTPQFMLGAEVQFFDHMEEVEEVSQLTIGVTGVLLLEMPFRPWDERTVRTVLELNGRGGLQIVLAHIERYSSFCRDKGIWQELRRSGVLMQVNASFFSGFLGRRRAMEMMRRGEFQLIGSDCHNLNERKPNWDLVPEEAFIASGNFAKELLGI